MDNYTLNNKSVLITGASGLLGAEHAAALLACGARVILTDINQTALQATKERLSEHTDAENILTYVMDVSDKHSILGVSEALHALNIRVDILINNAAIDPKVTHENSLLETSRFENFSFEQWGLELSVGLTGAFFCSQVFGTGMAEDGQGGVILNIASDLSVISPDQRLYQKEHLSEDMQPVKPVTYSVIKSGLIGLTRYLATYWADKGVRANALSPGGVYTGQDEAFVQRLTSLIPLGRMAKKEEYHSAVQFLCSDASSYLNGQNIIMDGGRSVW